MRLLAFCFLLFFCSQSVKGQTERVDILKMQQVYSGAKSFSMEISLQMFASQTDKQPVQTAKGKVMMKGVNYYSEMLGRTTVVNDHCCLLIDDNNKSILYSVVDSKQKKRSANDLVPVGDSTMLAGASLRYISKTSSERIIELSYKDDPQYDKVVVSINPQNYSMTRIVYYYRVFKDMKPAYEKAEISYSAIVLNSDLPASVFSESRFIKVGKETITALGKYAAYEVIDQRKYNKLASEKK